MHFVVPIRVGAGLLLICLSKVSYDLLFANNIQPCAFFFTINPLLKGWGGKKNKLVSMLSSIKGQALWTAIRMALSECKNYYLGSEKLKNANLLEADAMEPIELFPNDIDESSLEKCESGRILLRLQISHTIPNGQNADNQHIMGFTSVPFSVVEYDSELIRFIVKIDNENIILNKQ